MTPRLLDAGDAAFTVEFGNTVDPALVAAVNALDAAIARAQASGALPGLIETMPTFRSLTVFFDPLVTGRAALVDAIEPLMTQAGDVRTADGRRWRLPVCYQGDAAPDLAETAHTLGLTPDELVERHSGALLRVYMLGFLPGFPFIGDLPIGLDLPRRTQPRVRVPAGSVALAGGLTAIYPWESPGGWHLIGRCPVRLFDTAQDRPSLLAAGDRLRFEPVSADECARMEAAVAAGELGPSDWLLSDADVEPAEGDA